MPEIQRQRWDGAAAEDGGAGWIWIGEKGKERGGREGEREAAGGC